MAPRPRSMRPRGFTLIELIVVMAIVALLASIAAPRYMRSVDVARENALRSTLATLRDAIDQYAADRGHYPQGLDELVQQRYLRRLPQDPLTTRHDSWVAVSAPPDSYVTGALADVRSGAAGRAADGSLYADW
jgi:general secretion pathway protein G